MVFFFIVLLLISVAGMLVLLLVKHYELSTGRLIFASSRPKLSKFSSRMVFLFGTAVPLYVAWQAERSYKALSSWLHKGVARGVVTLEYWLESVLHTVREKTAATRAPGEASA